MADLRLLFTPAADTVYRAHLADARGRRLGVEVPFTPFLSDDDYEDLRWYLEEYLDLPDGGAVVRAERIERNLDTWGRRLHEALFTVPDNRALLDELLAGPEPRRLTVATRDPALLRLPWELLADESGSLTQRLSVCRQLEELVQAERATPRPAKLPLRILYIVSRPADAGFIDPRFTAKALLDALEPLGANVRVDFCRPPTLERMEEMLCIRQEAGDPFDIVHFDGHGTFLSKEQVGVLCFEKPADAFGASVAEFISAINLGDLLARHSIPLVILEACRSATVGKTTVFGSVAAYLIHAGVGSVLAMSHAVHVEATRLLLDSFYQGLVRGATSGQAVAEARKALRTTPSRWIESGPGGRTIELNDWFLPQLYQSAADEALVPAGANAETEEARRSYRSPAKRDEPGSFPPPPQFGFRGRARELHELERRFRAGRSMVLHAMGGMGKTALATEAAHWWTRSGLFRDGACFVSFEQFMSADRVVQVLGTYLDGPKFDQIPAAKQRRRAIALFRQKAVLLVWDNFESALPQFSDGAASPYTDDERHRLAELFRDLTTGRGRGCLLVTCRPGDTGLPGAQRYELQGLDRADSLWLLASILEREGLTLTDPRLSRENLEPLLRDLADHPLSLELVGPHLKTVTPEEIRADFGKILVEQQEAPEERNRSLLASLEFSLRHSNPAAREALPWLGLFSGGVFEELLLGVSQLTPEVWEPIRRELERIALLRTEGGLGLNGRPFLRFHLTLAFAVADSTLAQNTEIRQRFLEVYGVLMQTLLRALEGSQSRVALEILNREEANYRTAVQWAVADQQQRAAAELGEVFSRCLKMSGRFREHDALVQWLKDAVVKHGFTAEAADYERRHALTRFSQGDPQGAVDQLQTLIERLRHATDFDPDLHLMLALSDLGWVLTEAGAPAQAIPILRESIRNSKALVEKAGGRPWEALSPTRELINLSDAMGRLAYALMCAGQLAEALAMAEKCVGISIKQGAQRAVAAAHGRCADILREAGRCDEADARYALALATARGAGDKEMEGIILQNQGMLADDRYQLERASRLYQQALKRFQESGDQGSIMRTYNLLGVAERKANRLAEARVWHERSRELAVQLKDQDGLANAAQNIGALWHREGEAALDRGDETAARRHFEEARGSLKESLENWQALGRESREADSWHGLAIVHLCLGDLAVAERHAHEARQIHESLDLKEAWGDYQILSMIAQARGDLAAAAEWAKKRDDLLAELDRRAGGSQAEGIQYTSS